MKPPSPPVADAFKTLRVAHGYGKAMTYLREERMRLDKQLVASRKDERWLQGYIQCLDELLDLMA